LSASVKVWAVLVLAVTPALAGPRDEVRGASSRCDALVDDHAWLDCYYGAAQPMRAQLGLPPALASQQRLVPAAGGASWLSGGEAGPVHARMMSYSHDSTGAFTVSLSNGEVWRQLDGDPHIVHWKDRASGYQVSIAPGALGSYDMRVAGDNHVYKVKRLR
jgi:hypothetical protein